MSTDIDEIDRPLSPTIRVTSWLMITLFLAIVVGSIVARVEIVARGQGKIIPFGRVQVVQPLADGKILKILVSEGQFVRAGDLLMTLDAATAESEIKRIKANIERQRQDAAVARAIITPLAEADPASNGFVEAGRAMFRRTAIGDGHHADAEALVISILSALRDQIAQVEAQINRLKESQAAQSARLEKIRADREIVALKFGAAEALRNRGTISEFEYLARLRELKALEGDATIAASELDELVAEAAVLSKQRTSLISTTHSTYRKQLNEAEITLQSLEAELKAADNHLRSLLLKAPVSGRVERLSVFTVGGFVEAGSTLMSIVPIQRRHRGRSLFR